MKKTLTRASDACGALSPHTHTRLEALDALADLYNGTEDLVADDNAVAPGLVAAVDVEVGAWG